MPAADAARAFDRFHRGSHRGGAETGSAAETGSGLGLSIVAAIAAAHGGRTSLASVPGAGTTVQVWIPGKTQSPYAKRFQSAPAPIPTTA